MKHVVIAFGGLVSSFFFACSSAPLPDPGQPAPTVTQNCDISQQNSYQVCYPTTNIGTSVHTGTVSGSRIADFAFTGYAAMNVAPLAPNGPPASTQVVHLGDYFDPQGKGVANVIGGVPIKIIHISVGGLWCVYCNDEADHISGTNWSGTNPSPSQAWAAELAPLGVVFVYALSDGQITGTGATIADLNKWIAPTYHNDNFTTVLDPGVQNLGVFFDGGGIPFNLDVDARSMEILDAGDGYDSQLDQTLKTKWLPWIAANPPMP